MYLAPGYVVHRQHPGLSIDVAADILGANVILALVLPPVLPST